MVVGGRGVRVLEEVQLEVAYPQPLDRKAEVGRGHRLQAEEVDVETDRLLKV